MNLKDQYKQILAEATFKRLKRMRKKWNKKVKSGEPLDYDYYNIMDSLGLRRQNRDKLIARKVLQGKYGPDIQQQYRDVRKSVKQTYPSNSNISGTSNTAFMASELIRNRRSNLM